MVGLLPLTVLLALAVDVVQRSRLAWSRAVLFSTVYLCCEAWGIGISALLWLLQPILGPERFATANHALQRQWSRALLGSLVGIFQLRIEVEGAEVLAGGPLLLLVRHASMIDTVLPMHLVTIPNRFRARYVLKAELLWDPCLDIVGNRIPNAFVHRGRGESEVAIVGALGEGLGADGLVVLFPEGTRYSPSRQARRLERMADRSDAMLAAARALQHTMPPYTGGALALIAAAPAADMAFCAHTGLEGIQGFAQLPALVGRRIQVGFWRVPAAEIPAESQRQWLYQQWARVDAWVAARREP